MNCKQVENLLPLFVGGDLEVKHERLVTAHLETCGACAGAAIEYRESRQMLQEFVAPTFSDDLYAGIRQSVWSQIETESNAPPISEIVAGWFRLRLVWATASVILIAIMALGVYFNANRSARQHQTAGNEPNRSPSPKNKEPEAQSGSNKLANTDSIPVGDNNSERRQANDRQHQRRRDRVWAPDRAKTIAGNSPDAKLIQVETPATAGIVTAVSEKTVRMEIQTRNPNIRIIWFSQRESKPPSPNSKGI